MQEEETARIPTTEKLAQALDLAHAPHEMITRARAGVYDDYTSDLPAPIMQLVQDARAAGLLAIAERTLNGEFDAQDWEAEQWAQSPEGQETVAHLLTRAGTPRGPYKRGGNKERSRQREQARQDKKQKGKHL